MGSNKLSFLTDEVIPKYIRENNNDYVVFVQNYFEYLEREFGEYDVVANLLQYRDIDYTVDAYIDEFRKNYAPQLPAEDNTAVNLKFLIKKIREFYKSKGTEDSLKFLFKAVYNSSVEFYYPSDDVLKTSIARHKISEKNSHITDSNFWQDFSYVIRTGISGHIYEKLLYAMGHPAGLKYFAEFKPSAEVHTADIPTFVDSWVVILFIDYVISGLNLSIADDFTDILIENTANGPRDSVSKFLWEREEKENNLLQDFEDTTISQLDGRSSEQHSLVFYNRKKQDMNSMVVIDRYVEFIDSDINTSYYWDNNVDISSSGMTDITTTAPSTISNGGSVDFSALFSDGDKIYLESANDLEEGLYTVSGAPTATDIVITEATLTTQSAVALGSTSISTRTAADWYTTPLRAQPTTADDTVHIITMPLGEYGNNINAHDLDKFKVMSSVDSLTDGLFFYNGDKLISSDLSLSIADVNDFRTVTSTLSIPVGNSVEYYVTQHSLEEYVMSNITDLTIDLTNHPILEKKTNLQVFAEGVLLYPTEYKYQNGELRINASLWGSIVNVSDRIEVIFFNRNVNHNYITHNTVANQSKFEIRKNVEKRIWVSNSESIGIWNGSTPTTDVDPTPTSANGWNYTGTILRLGEIPVIFAELSAVILADTPINYWKFDEITGTTAVDTIGNGNMDLSGGDFSDTGFSIVSTRADEIGTAISMPQAANTWAAFSNSGHTPSSSTSTLQNGDFTFSGAVSLGTVTAATTPEMFGLWNEGMDFGFWYDEASDELRFRSEEAGNNTGNLTLIPDCSAIGLSGDTVVWMVLEADTITGFLKAFVNNIEVGSIDMSAWTNWNGDAEWRCGNRGCGSFNSSWNWGIVDVQWQGVFDEWSYYNKILTPLQKLEQYSAWEGIEFVIEPLEDVIVALGPQHYYKLDESIGASVATDTMGNGDYTYHEVLQAGDIVTSSRADTVGSTIQWADTAQGIGTTTLGTGSLGSGDFTIEWAMRNTSTPAFGTKYWFDKYQVSEALREYQIYFQDMDDGAHELWFSLYESGGTLVSGPLTQDIIGDGYLEDQTWQWWSLCMDTTAELLTLKLNDVEIASIDVSFSSLNWRTGTAATGTIGSAGASETEGLNGGAMDEIAIYHKVLTDIERTSTYTSWKAL